MKIQFFTDLINRYVNGVSKYYLGIHQDESTNIIAHFHPVDIDMAMNILSIHDNYHINFTEHHTELSINADWLSKNDLSLRNRSITRIYCDLALSKLKFHNPNQFQSFLEKAKEIDREKPLVLLAKIMEETRLEYIMKKSFPGSGKNLSILLANVIDTQNFLQDNIDLISIFAILLRYKFNQDINSTYLKEITKFHDKLELIINRYKPELLANIYHPEEYYQISLRLIKRLANFDSEEMDKDLFDDKIEEPHKEQKDRDNSNDNLSDSNPPSNDSSKSKTTTSDKASSEPQELKDKDIDDEQQDFNPLSDSSTENGESSTQLNVTPVFRYKIFTHKWDKIIGARELISSGGEKYLWEEFIKKINKLAKPKLHHIQKLIRKLTSSMNDKRNFDQEMGYLDSRKLALAIAENKSDFCYYNIDLKKLQNSTVTILLDNSGSMRGRPITLAAMGSWILGEILSKYNINFEILGFTTVNWQGGEVKKIWEQMGNPANPGRLNSILHIIYKNVNKSWHQEKKFLSVMLKEGLLKENIDGEALLWASKRLSYRSEENKILMIISDGTPMDDSTSFLNDKNYLEDHLKQVIHFIENKTSIKLCAICIGHDVGKYYKNSIRIEDAEELSTTMLSKLSEII